MLISSVRLFLPAAVAMTILSAAAHAEVWRSQGYGYVLVADADKVQVYDLAADRCTLSDTVPALSSLGRIEQRDSDHFVLAGDISRIGFERPRPACSL